MDRRTKEDDRIHRNVPVRAPFKRPRSASESMNGRSHVFRLPIQCSLHNTSGRTHWGAVHIACIME